MDIASNIATTLKSIFPNVPVNRENADDGSFTTPCIFVSQLQTQFNQKPNHEQLRTYNFDVQYIIDEFDKPFATLQQASDALISQMTYLIDETGSPFAQVQNQSLDIIDKVLHYQFQVFVRVADDTEVPMFENISQNGGLKNG